jgi:hypothetical protein
LRLVGVLVLGVSPGNLCPNNALRPSRPWVRRGRIGSFVRPSTKIFWWLYDHRDEIEELARATPVDWPGLCDQLHAAGITDARGKPLRPVAVSGMWQRLQAAGTSEGWAVIGQRRPRGLVVPPLHLPRRPRDSRRSSPLFWWFYDHHAELFALAAVGSIDWLALCKHLRGLGITNAWGNGLTHNTVYVTWRRCREALATEGSEALARRRPPGPVMPSLDLARRRHLIHPPSVLFWWLYDHEAQIRALANPGPIPWRRLAERIGPLGVRDGAGRIPGIDTTRVTWARVAKALREEGRRALVGRRPPLPPLRKVSARWWQKLSPVTAGGQSSTAPPRILIRRRPGKSRRTPLFWWMYDHREKMRSLERRGRISWITLCRQMSMIGFVDPSGRPILPHLARATWRGVQRAIATKRI